MSSTGRTRRSRLARVVVNLGLLMASCVVALVVFEAALRVAGIAFPRFYRDDLALGSVHLEGAAGWWTQEGHAWVEINSDGLRDREHAVPKPPGAYRIAVLGDSFAAAFEVEREAAFWSVMEHELAQCPALRGRTVEALNFGVAGYGTARQYRMLEHRVWKYEPDLVLLAFFPGNDVRNNSWELERDRRAYYFRLVDGRLVVDPDFLANRGRLEVTRGEQTWRFLHARSRVVQVYERARRTLKDWRRDPDERGGASPGPEPGLGDAVFAAPRDPVWAEAWRITEALVQAIAASVREHGAQFAIAILSSGIQVDPDRDKRARSAAAIGVPDLLWPDRQVAGWAERLGVPHVLLAPELADWAEANRTCVHGFDNAIPCGGHWNEHGHRLAGERIAKLVCASVAGGG